MRGYKVGEDSHATDIDTGEVARKLVAWLAVDADAILTGVIQTRLWPTAGQGRLGTLAEPAWDVAPLRVEVIAALQLDPANAGRRMAR